MRRPGRCPIVSILAAVPLLGSRTVAAQDARPSLRVGTGAETIVLDGRLDEAAWAAAPAIAGLSQVEPQERGTASAVTTVRVLVDSRMLVFGIDARRGPAPLTAFARGRDAGLGNEDHVRLVLDPFGDGRSGYLFAVNPNGARFDALITNQGEGENDDWDAVWEAATTVSDSGWTAEIRIPAKSLTFPPSADRWAMNLQRRIQAALETDRWASPTRDRKFGQTAGAGWLTGLPRFDLGLGLTFRPSVVTGGGHPQPHTDLDGEFNLSLDVEKRIGAALLGSATVNTDFAETEADTRRSNLTRFPLFFPEKRNFFLEGSDVFEFGLGLGTELLPFFSRRIGLVDGATVPIQAGLKLTGQQGATRIGALAVRTGEGPAAAERFLGVVRVRQNILQESSIGAILTAGDPRGGRNWLGGADVTYRTSRFGGNRNLLIGVSLLGTGGDGASGERTAWSARIDYPNDLFDLAATYKRIGDGFDPALGFVPRAGVQLLSLNAEIAPRPGRYGIRQMFFENRFNLATDLDGRWESYRWFLAPVNWRLESGDRFEANVVPQGERLVAPFEVSDGVVIDPGTYRFTRYRLEAEFAARRRLSGQLTWWFGGFYDGHLHQIEVETNWRPSSAAAVELNLERNIGTLAGGHFTQTVVGARIQVNPSPDLLLNTLIQYDDESRSVGTNSRLRWTVSPTAEVFLIYNHNVRDRLDRWEFESNRLLAKLQLAIRR